ncbi:MAG: PAS domain S-box protein [Sedimenticolaceae bacterium]
MDADRTETTDSVRFPRYEFLVLFLPVAVIVLVVGSSFATLRIDSQIEAVLDDDNTRLQYLGGFIGAQVSGSLNQLLAIADEPITRRAIESADAASLSSLEGSLLGIARRNPYYQQIRWIDQSGRERVRISREDSEPFIVPTAELQDKSGRYYVKAAMALLPGELYISPLDFNVEHGEVEKPLRATLRIAKRVLDDQRRSSGILVFNIAMQPVFDAIEDLSKLNHGVRYLVLNKEGQVLNASRDVAQTGSGQDGGIASFPETHPDIWNAVVRTSSGNAEAEDGLWTWSALRPADVFHRMKEAFPRHAAAVDQLVSDRFELTLVANRPVRFLLDTRSDSRMLVSLATLLGLSIYGLSLYLYLSGHVRERRAQLQAGYAVARAEHLARTKKLEERYHRLFEASSVGQLVVDATGRIEIGNAAAERLLGYTHGELNGLAVETLLPAAMRNRHIQQRDRYLAAPEARKMGQGRNLEALQKDGGTIPVEVGLNPYIDEGRQLVLVTIIDVSGLPSTPRPAA